MVLLLEVPPSNASSTVTWDAFSLQETVVVNVVVAV